MGVTMSVFQNQDDWWGEGDDMFFIDGETTPSIIGTGAEDYFLGAWDFATHSFSYGLFGAPEKRENRAGSRWSVYRFHLDSPIPLVSQCAPRSSTATLITVRMIISPLPTGIRLNLTVRSRRCPRSPCSFHGSIPWAGPAMRENNKATKGPPSRLV